MTCEAPNQFRSGQTPPGQLRLQSFSALGSYRGLFVKPEPVIARQDSTDVITRRKRELYDVRGRGGKGIGYAYDDCR
jgi:hypothetical protein